MSGQLFNEKEWTALQVAPMFGFLILNTTMTVLLFQNLTDDFKNCCVVICSEGRA